MARKREQVVALIPPGQKTHLDALRIITEQSRAQVLEEVCAIALPILAERHAAGFDRISALAARAGMSFDAYVGAYAETFARYSDVGLEALEIDDRKVTGKRTKPEPIVFSHAA